MVELFHASWDKHFQSKVNGKVTSDEGASVEYFPSTFVLELRNTVWIPITKKRRRLLNETAKSPRLSLPAKAFVRSKLAEKILDEHVHYVDANVSDIGGDKESRFLIDTGLKSRHGLNLPVVMTMLKKWTKGAVADDPSNPKQRKLCIMSQYHMNEVYLHLTSDRAAIESVKTFFQTEPVFFVPGDLDNEEEQQKSGVEGSFFHFNNVCWEDPTRALETRRQRNCIVPGPHLLSSFYDSFNSPKYRLLKSCLLEVIGLNEIPTCGDYVNLIHYIVSCEGRGNPSWDQVHDVHDVILSMCNVFKNAVARKLYERAKKRPLATKGEPWKEYEREMKTTIFEDDVRNNRGDFSFLQDIADKRIFFTKRKRWISLNESPVIDDTIKSEGGRFFEHNYSVHFVDVFVEDDRNQEDSRNLTRRKGESQNDFENRRSNAMRKSRRKDKVTEAVRFLWAACGIPRLSNCLGKDVKGSGRMACSQLHSYLSRIVPYVQRFVCAGKLTEAAVTRKAVNEAASCLSRLQCVMAKKLVKIFWIDGVPKSNVEKIVEAAVVIEDNRSQLIVAENCLTSKTFYQSVNHELVGLLASKRSQSERRNLEHFLNNVAEKLPAADNYVQQMYRLPPLPKGEKCWGIAPLQECAEAETGTEDAGRVEEASEDYEYDFKAEEEKASSAQKNPDDDDALKRWPPGKEPGKESAGSGPKLNLPWPIPRPAEQSGNATEDGPKEIDEHLAARQPELQHGQQSEQPYQSNTNEAQPSSFSLPYAPASFLPPQLPLRPLAPTAHPLPLPFQLPGTSFIPPAGPGHMRMPTPFTPRSIIQLQLEDVAVPSHLDAPKAPVDSADRHEVARYGEELVYSILRGQMQQGLLNYCYGVQASGVEQVQWVNEGHESFAPFDIRIVFLLHDGQRKEIFVEVKTTVMEKKDLFPISGNELGFAQMMKENFSLYRVFNAGKSNVKVSRLQNLAHYVNTNQVQLYLHI